MKELVYGRNRQGQKKTKLEESFFEKGKSGGRQNNDYHNRAFFLSD
jgi:hypothetical protein